MPSLRADALKVQLKLLQPITMHASIKMCRKAQDSLGELCAVALSDKVSFSDFDIGRFKACFITPNELLHTENAILYLHGGAYTAGSLGYTRAFGSILASKSGICTLCPAYRLAPEHPYPAALYDAFSAYANLLRRGYKPENIIFAGESAGGGLLYALMLKLKSLNMPLPGSAIALSPWTDLTFTGKTHETNAPCDPSLSSSALKYYASCYAPDNCDSPYVSPIYGDVAGFPPSLIIVGGDEVLLDDSLMMQKRLTDAGCSVTMHVEDGMWHVYPLYGLPESEEALNMISIFVEAHV